MKLVRTRAQGSEKEDIRLVLQWYSQNGEMRIDLVNPRLEFFGGEADNQLSKFREPSR